MFLCYYFFFFFNDTATTEIYTLSLHDALPILRRGGSRLRALVAARRPAPAPPGRRRLQRLVDVPDPPRGGRGEDRKSTRLNSSHANISYAVFCLKKKKKYNKRTQRQ